MVFVEPGPVYQARTKNARTDTRLILDVLAATRRWQDDRGVQAAVKPIREMIWAHWELPRMREIRTNRHGTLVRQKYPAWVPWSPSARTANATGGRISLEHVHPANLIVRDLLETAPKTEGVLIRKLIRLLQYAVVTPTDNEALRAARVHNHLAPDSADPWDRYRHAGLPLHRFRPLIPLPGR
jgi:hypothetical protein